MSAPSRQQVAVIQDLRYALRSLRRSPGFTTVAVLTLALGIGANTAMFSVVYGILLRPLPYPQPQRIVELAATDHGARGALSVTYKEFRFLDERRTGFQYLAATTSVGVNLFAGDQAERVDALRVSREYFRVLGVAPAIGRAFTGDEDQPAGPAVAILSHGLWVRRFGADPAVVGRSILLDGRPTTVVGVMPAGFHAMQDPTVDLWSTLAQAGTSVGGGENLEVVGRLAPGISLAGARAQMQALTAPFQEQFHEYGIPRSGSMDVFRYRDLETAQLERPTQILFGAIAFVLLIACANVANLVLGRATMREREVAVRVALGVGRGRLTRLILAETLVLALAGGALGLMLASWGLSGMLAILPAGLPRAEGIHLDRWALAFTLALSLAMGVVFGLLPGWRAARADVQEALKEGGSRTGQSARRGRLRSALVVGEVALSLVLLVGAALLVRTFANLTRDDVGFRVDHLLTAEIWLNGTRYDSTAHASVFYDVLTRQLDAIPGVQAAGVVEAGLPLRRGGFFPALVDGVWHSVEYRTVTPDYLGALGVPLFGGRVLTGADDAAGEPVAVVNRTFARQFIGDSDAVGHMVSIGGKNHPYRIVGVVGDTKSFIGESARPDVFIPSAQTPPSFSRLFSTWYPTNVVLRTAVDPASLEDALVRTIHETDPAVPVGRVRTMDEVQGGALALQRSVMLLSSFFAAMALSLAAVGVYGVMSYFAAAHIHEIGVRMALGALPGNVVRLVLSRGMGLVLAGVAIGLAGAAALTRMLANALYGVTATDPLTFAAVTAVLAAVALAACYVPARRAARGNPVEALRYE